MSPLLNSHSDFMNTQLDEQLQERLRSLKAEYAAGQQILLDLETKHMNLQQTLLRISGAIQVLEEEHQKLLEKPLGIS
jgi:uncharacterized protein (DUF3084 family)